MNIKSVFSVLVLTGFLITAHANDYDYSGAVIEHKYSENRIEIDYQVYSIRHETVIQGNTLRGEYGPKLSPGQHVEFNTLPSTDGPPLITQLRILTDDSNSL